MNPAELIAILGTKVQNWERMPTGIPTLTQQDVAASLAMIKHPYAVLLLRVKYGLQADYLGALSEHVQQQVTRDWALSRWPLPRDRSPLVFLGDLSQLALWEFLVPHRCMTCGGIGNRIVNAKQIKHKSKHKVKIGQVIECPVCKGSGFKRPTQRSRAEVMHMDYRNWERRYADYYRDVLVRLDYVESLGFGAMVKRLYDRKMG